MIALTE